MGQHHRHNQTGQSLLEVVVASAVGILVVSALAFATIFSIRNASFAKNSAQATKLAQEGIEWVRIGRDRNSPITDLIVNSIEVKFWSGPGPIWIQLSGYGLCDDPAVNPPLGGKCYFNVNSDGALTNIGFALDNFPEDAEEIPVDKTLFKRVVLLLDEGSYSSQKTVTVIVRWEDFTGPHESKLTTILRKL